MDILAREKAKRKLSEAMGISRKEANRIMDRMVIGFREEGLKCKRN